MLQTPTSLTVYTKDLESYIPILDARRLSKPSIINGRNFIFDIDGPRSAFSAVFRTWEQFSEMWRANINDFQLDDETHIYGSAGGLWIINPETLAFEYLLEIVTTNKYWPWTFAKVGGLFYFAQYDIGLWQYNPTTRTLTEIATPAVVRGVCLSYGRLVCLSDTTVFWSALDDGTDFTPSVVTGAGAQTLSILSRVAYAIQPVANGVVIFTNRGIIKGEFIQANFIFRWYVLSTDVRVFSPNAVVAVPDSGLISLSPSGLHVTDAGKPEPWEQLHGEYFKRNYLQAMDRRKIGCVLLNYSRAAKTLFVSFAPNALEGVYTIAFTYFIPSGKWSVFSKSHRGFFEFVGTPDLIDYCAYMGTDGYLYTLSDVADIERLPSAPNGMLDYVYRLSDDPGTIIVDGTVLFRSEAHFTDIVPSVYANVAASGVYERQTEAYTAASELAEDPEATMGSPIIFAMEMDFSGSGFFNFAPTVYIFDKLGLNSEIELGPYRFAEQQNPDEQSAITGFILGLQQASLVAEIEDWNILSGEEDWNDDPESYEDWGANFGIPNVFDLHLMATDDGVQPQEQGEELLTAIKDDGSTKQYSPNGYSAIMHRIRITADDPGESYAIKYIDIAGMLTGRRV